MEAIQEKKNPATDTINVSGIPAIENPVTSETEKTVEEFKQKFKMSLERDRTKLKEAADKEAKLILENAYQVSAGLSARGHEEYKLTIDRAKEEARKAKESLLAEAQKEKAEILENSRLEGRRSAEAEASQIVCQAKKEAENIVESARERTRTQLKETDHLIMTFQQRVTQLIDGDKPRKSELPAPVFSSLPVLNSTPPVTVVSAAKPVAETEIMETEKTENRDSGNIRKKNGMINNLNNNKLQIKVEVNMYSSISGEQLAALEKDIKQNTNLKLIGRVGRPDGINMLELELLKKAVLIDILNELPGVKDVIGCKCQAVLTLKTWRPG